jgi:hypothetical protein
MNDESETAREFRISWEQAMRGETFPIETLFDGSNNNKVYILFKHYHLDSYTHIIGVFPNFEDAIKCGGILGIEEFVLAAHSSNVWIPKPYELYSIEEFVMSEPDFSGEE